MSKRIALGAVWLASDRRWPARAAWPGIPGSGLSWLILGRVPRWLTIAGGIGCLAVGGAALPRHRGEGRAAEGAERWLIFSVTGEPNRCPRPGV